MEQHPSVGSNNNSSSSLRLPKGDDYRAFVFCLHDRHGALLLHCTRKAQKPPHFQIPGGHLDGGEEGHVCAARELHEETGIRVDAERLQPLHLYQTDGRHEFKQRLFYQLRLTDADFPKDNSGVPAMEEFGDPQILLKLSDEHSGFTFRPIDAGLDEWLKHHSGGKVAEAWRMAWHAHPEQFQ